MAKDPAFLFYYQDFLVGTDHMTDEQIGQYIKCLCHQANRGSIRVQHMKNICKTHENHMIVSEKFTEHEDGGLMNKRLNLEMIKRKEYADSRRNNRKSKNISFSYVPHMENEDINGNGKRNKRFNPPSLEEVRDYCQERRNKVDPEYFIDFYQSKDWMVGKNKMKDWKASLRRAEKWGDNVSSKTVDNIKRKKPDSNCKLGCGGSGELYAPGSGKTNPCKCTEDN